MEVTLDVAASLSRQVIAVMKSSDHRDLIFIDQMMPTIAEDYLRIMWNHFLLFPRSNNTNTDKFSF